MLIRIVAVGRVREAYIRDGIAEYAKRLKAFARVEIVEVREEAFKERLSPTEKQMVLEREGEAILKALGPEHVVVMDIDGTQLTSEELAQHIGRLRVQGESVFSFVIGGSLGVAQAVRDRANLRLSFGRITFPHQLFRLVLMEQLYRASTIIRGVPYHK